MSAVTAAAAGAPSPPGITNGGGDARTTSRGPPAGDDPIRCLERAYADARTRGGNEVCLDAETCVARLRPADVARMRVYDNFTNASVAVATGEKVKVAEGAMSWPDKPAKRAGAPVNNACAVTKRRFCARHGARVLLHISAISRPACRVVGYRAGQRELRRAAKRAVARRGRRDPGSDGRRGARVRRGSGLGRRHAVVRNVRLRQGDARRRDARAPSRPPAPLRDHAKRPRAPPDALRPAAVLSPGGYSADGVAATPRPRREFCAENGSRRRGRSVETGAWLRYAERCAGDRACTPCSSLIRRYREGERRSHAPHEDSEAFATVVVSLANAGDEFEGGLYVAVHGGGGSRRLRGCDVDIPWRPLRASGTSRRRARRRSGPSRCNGATRSCIAEISYTASTLNAASAGRGSCGTFAERTFGRRVAATPRLRRGSFGRDRRTSQVPRLAHVRGPRPRVVRGMRFDESRVPGPPRGPSGRPGRRGGVVHSRGGERPPAGHGQDGALSPRQRPLQGPRRAVPSDAAEPTGGRGVLPRLRGALRCVVTNVRSRRRRGDRVPRSIPWHRGL